MLLSAIDADLLQSFLDFYILQKKNRTLNMLQFLDVILFKECSLKLHDFSFLIRFLYYLSCFIMYLHNLSCFIMYLHDLSCFMMHLHDLGTMLSYKDIFLLD